MAFFSVFSFLLADKYTFGCLGRDYQLNYFREYLCTTELEVF